MNWSAVSDHYSKLLGRYGNSHKSLDWGSSESQQLRFKVLSQVDDISGESVLDVGCGLADFWVYMQGQKIELDYTGIDLNLSMIEKARERFPSLRLIHGNILEYDFGESRFDYVIASGIFTILKEKELENVKNIIRKMLYLANNAVAFNALSSWSKQKQPGEFHLDPVKTVEFCKELIPGIVMRHDYMPHDFTMYLYKQSDK